MKNWKEMLKNRKVVAAICGVAAVAVIGIGYYVNRGPEWPEYVDTLTDQKVEEDSPLGDAPVVETKTQKKTDNKTVKLAKASTRTYTKNLGTKTTTTKKDSSTSEATIVTEEKKDVTRKETYTKGSKIKKVTTETTITITTTTTKKAAAPPTGTKNTPQADGSSSGKESGDIYALAQGLDTRVLSAFVTLGFKVVIDPSFNQGDGLFDAKNRTITLRTEDRGHAIHEMGHFLAFINGITQKSNMLMKAYNGEKANFPGVYFLYATSDPNEFFAECTREYYVGSSNKSALTSKCPEISKLIEACVNNIDSSLIKDIAKRYR